MPIASSHHRTAFVIILLVLAVSPWPLGSNRDWAWPVLTILTALAALTVIFAGQSHQNRHHKIILSALVFLVGYMLCQYHGIPMLLEPLTQYFYGTRSDIAKTIMYLGFFYATAQLVNCPDRCRLVIYVVVITGLLQALLGGAQQLMFELPRARGSFPNPNHFAGYLEVALCLAIGLMIADKPQKATSGGNSVQGSFRMELVDIMTGPLARLRVIIVIMVVALVMSRSRMGNVAFFSSILITAAIAFFYTRSLNRYTAILLVSILAIDALIISSYFGIEKLEQRLRNTTTTDNTRIDLQKYNLEILRNHAWLGTGAGSYEVVFAGQRDAEIQTKVTHAESDYIELLIELGFIGTASLIIVLATGIHAQVSLLNRSTPPFERGIAFGCLSGTLAILIHGIADVNLQIPSNALLLVLLLAIPVGLGQARVQNSGDFS